MGRVTRWRQNLFFLFFGGYDISSGNCHSRQGATGVPLFTTWDSVAGPAWGEPQYLETFRAGADPGIILFVLVAQLVGRLRRWILGGGLRVGGPGTPTK